MKNVSNVKAIHKKCLEYDDETFNVYYTLSNKMKYLVKY